MESPKDALQARSRILEKQLAKQQQSEEELRIAKERLSSQTIDVDKLPEGNEEIEQLFNAAQEQVILLDGPTGVSAQAFGQKNK